MLHHPLELSIAMFSISGAIVAGYFYFKSRNESANALANQQMTRGSKPTADANSTKPKASSTRSASAKRSKR